MALDILGTFSRKWFKKLFDDFLDPFVQPQADPRAQHQHKEVERYRIFLERVDVAREAKQGVNGDIQWETEYKPPTQMVRTRGALDDGDATILVQDVMVQAIEPLKFKHERLEYQGKMAADHAEFCENDAKALENWHELLSTTKSKIEEMFASGQHSHHLFEDGQAPVTLYSEDPRYKNQQPVPDIPLAGTGGGAVVTQVPEDRTPGPPGTDPSTGIQLSIYSPPEVTGGRVPGVISNDEFPPPPSPPGQGLGEGEGAVGIGPPIDPFAVPIIPPPGNVTLPPPLPGASGEDPVGIGPGAIPPPAPPVSPPEPLPDGSGLLDDGSVIFPDVEVIGGRPTPLPPGTVLLPDCSLQLPNGTIIPRSTNCRVIEEGVVDKDGNVFDPCTGGIILSDGSIKLANGDVIIDGCTYRFDGKVVWPDGSIVDRDCKVHRPNGEVWLSNGDILFPDGNVKHPDGSVTNPEGAVVIPAPKECVKSNPESPSCKDCPQKPWGIKCFKIPKCFPQGCKLS